MIHDGKAIFSKSFPPKILNIKNISFMTINNVICNLTILNDYSKYIEILNFSPNDRNQLQKILKLDNVSLQAFIDSIAKCFINNIS